MNFCGVFGFYKIEVKALLYLEHKFEDLIVRLKENEAVGRAELEEGKKERGRKPSYGAVSTREANSILLLIHIFC